MTTTLRRQARRATSADDLDSRVRAYWNTHVHDAGVSAAPVGTAQFFADLESYRYHKLDYLPKVIDFDAYAGRDVLEIGCGAGLDMARFARGGARVVGLDASRSVVGVARRRLELADVAGRLLVGSGAALPFPDHSFDLVYCHGVLPYVADPDAVVHEAYRVLRKGGEAVLMAYHRRSWLYALSRAGGVRLAHADAPVLRTVTRNGLQESVRVFEFSTIIVERFPVPTRLHGGWKAAAFNRLFVPLFRHVPRSLVEPFGWHLLAFCRRLS